MSTLVGWALVIALLASRPIEARFWRAGRLSDRATALLILGRMPAIVLVAVLVAGVPSPLTASLIAISLVPVALGYRFVMGLLAAERAGQPRI
jgi:hypothetical protein